MEREAVRELLGAADSAAPLERFGHVAQVFAACGSSTQKQRTQLGHKKGPPLR